MKKKNRPKFPNGYKKRKKTTTVKLGKNNLKAIGIFKETLKTLRARETHNAKELANEMPVFRNSVLNPLREQIKYLENAISRLENKQVIIKGRISEKRWEEFKSAWTFKDKTAAGYYDIKFTVNDRESNFKRLILDELANQGVDIYNPVELNKVLKGHTLDEVVENYDYSNLDEDENDYTAIKDNVEGWIEEVVEEIDRVATATLKGEL